MKQEKMTIEEYQSLVHELRAVEAYIAHTEVHVQYDLPAILRGLRVEHGADSAEYIRRSAAARELKASLPKERARARKIRKLLDKAKHIPKNLPPCTAVR